MNYNADITIILLYSTLVVVKTQFMLQADTNPQIDEVVWQAWVEKNRAQDKFRFVRRLRAMGLVTVFLMVSALLWRLTR